MSIKKKDSHKGRKPKLLENMFLRIKNMFISFFSGKVSGIDEDSLPYQYYRQSQFEGSGLLFCDTQIKQPKFKG